MDKELVLKFFNIVTELEMDIIYFNEETEQFKIYSSKDIGQYQPDFYSIIELKAMAFDWLEKNWEGLSEPRDNRDMVVCKIDDLMQFNLESIMKLAVELDEK